MSVTTQETGETKETVSFRNKIKPIWCPGCGDFGVLNGLVKALETLELRTEDVAVISGIGCSSRLPGYLACYGFNGIHGRAIPVATGLKLARPELTVVVTGGDGDGFAIGGNHLTHAARRNIDLTYILMDNGIYGLTKGQVSPTTPLGYKTKTTYYGAFEKPVNPVEVILAFGASFVAQGFAADIKHLTSLIIEAIKYPGFAYINVISPCVTYRGGAEQYKALRERVSVIGPEHDVADWNAAHRMSRDTERLHIGVLYKEPRETYDAAQHALMVRAPHAEAAALDSLAEQYR